MQENSLTPKTTKEEKAECLREREKDGLKTTLTSLEVWLRKNNNIEITSKLILKKIPKMTMSMRKSMS